MISFSGNGGIRLFPQALLILTGALALVSATALATDPPDTSAIINNLNTAISALPLKQQNTFISQMGNLINNYDTQKPWDNDKYNRYFVGPVTQLATQLNVPSAAITSLIPAPTGDTNQDQIQSAVAAVRSATQAVSGQVTTQMQAKLDEDEQEKQDLQKKHAADQQRQSEQLRMVEQEKNQAQQQALQQQQQLQQIQQALQQQQQQQQQQAQGGAGGGAGGGQGGGAGGGGAGGAGAGGGGGGGSGSSAGVGPESPKDPLANLSSSTNSSPDLSNFINPSSNPFQNASPSSDGSSANSSPAQNNPGAGVNLPPLNVADGGKAPPSLVDRGAFNAPKITLSGPGEIPKDIQKLSAALGPSSGGTGGAGIGGGGGAAGIKKEGNGNKGDAANGAAGDPFQGIGADRTPPSERYNFIRDVAYGSPGGEGGATTGGATGGGEKEGDGNGFGESTRSSRAYLGANLSEVAGMEPPSAKEPGIFGYRGLIQNLCHTPLGKELGVCHAPEKNHPKKNINASTKTSLENG